MQLRFVELPYNIWDKDLKLPNKLLKFKDEDYRYLDSLVSNSKGDFLTILFYG